MKKASAFYYTFCFIFEYWQEKENGLFGCRKNRFPKLHLQVAKNELKSRLSYLEFTKQDFTQVKFCKVGGRELGHVLLAENTRRADGPYATI